MPISADDSHVNSWAVDTSVAVAYLDGSHVAHGASVAAVSNRRPALAGHAAFETFGVLTRLPGVAQVHPSDAAAALAAAFVDPCWLTAKEHSSLLGRLGTLGLRGGACYDALVGEAARARGRVLLTRDRRATRTYDLLGVRYVLVE
jgi:predicted nucleic acid-binding protein